MIVLLFDVDGVLADTEHLHRQALAQIAAEAGYTIPDIDARTTEAKLLAGGVPKEEVPKLYALKRERYEQLIETVPKNPALATALYRLYGKQYRMAACTNSNRHSVTKLLKHLGIYGVFSAVISSSDVSRGKPFPDIYLQALDVMGGVRASTVVFEDSDVGVRAAEAAGIQHIVRCTTATLLKELEPWLS